MAGLVHGRETAASERERQAAFAQEHPIVNLAAQMVGSGPWYTAGAGWAAAAPPWGARMAAGGALGGALGAGQGAGVSEPGNRLPGALIGGTMGAAVGIPTLGFGPTLMRRQTLAGRAQESRDLGLNMVRREGLQGNAVNETQAELAAQNAALMTAGSNPTSTIGDTRIGRRIMEGIIGKSGQAEGRILEALTERTAGAKAEFDNMLRVASGG